VTVARAPARKGPWQITPAAAEQAQACIKAADMAARGARYADIAAELGLASPLEAKKCVIRGYSLAPGEDYRMGRRKAADELDLLRREFWKIVDDPGWATTVTGKLIVIADPETGIEGPVPDRQAKIAALNGLRAVNAEYRKLFGTDAPRQTVAIQASTSLDELQSHIARVKAEIAAAEAGELDQGPDDGAGPLALPAGSG
jgi:hypothetical protein